MTETRPSPETLARGYEATAINPRHFVVALAVFLIFSIALSIVLLFTMRAFSKMDEMKDSSRNKMWTATTQPLPPGPWLQPSIAQDEPRQPFQDMEAFREQERHVLNTYGSLNAANGTVRIPIDRAMHILAERGTPSTQPAGGGR